MVDACKLDDALAAACGDLWLNSRILSDVTRLCDEYGHRFAGSQSEARAREFIIDRLRSYGLENVTVEPCRYTSWKRGACSLELLAPRRRPLTSLSMVHAPGTPPGGLDGEVISVGQGTQAEFDRLGSAVRGKIAILGDDVIMTGGTLIANAEALLEHGASEVWAFATHGVFCGDALDRFAKSELAGIVVTDTVPINPLTKPDNLAVLKVSGLLAETVMNVFADDSVSAIFGGENQLF